LRLNDILASFLFFGLYSFGGAEVQVGVAINEFIARNDLIVLSVIGFKSLPCLLSMIKER
jgi:chromate transport protein ChrA